MSYKRAEEGRESRYKFLSNNIAQDLSQTDWEAIKINISKSKKRGLVCSGYSYAPIHLLVESGKPPNVEILLVKGANIEAKDNNGHARRSYAQKACR